MGVARPLTGAHWIYGLLGDNITVERKCRYVDDGVVTSAGVAAGIDMSIYVIEKLCGKAIADETAHYIDYPRHAA